MSHPDNYPEFRDHIHEHGDKVQQIVIQNVARVKDCGDPKCKWPAFWEGLTDEQLEGAAIVLMRFAHEMGMDTKANSLRYGEFVHHVASEQMRRDGKILDWTCFSEGAK